MYLWKNIQSCLLVLGPKWMSLSNVDPTSNNFNCETDKLKEKTIMNNQYNSNNSAIIESGSTLDYVRMVNEVSMEEASVLSAGAWVERDDTGFECS